MRRARHMETYGTKRERSPRLSVKNRAEEQQNPTAPYANPINDSKCWVPKGGVVPLNLLRLAARTGTVRGGGLWSTRPAPKKAGLAADRARGRIGDRQRVTTKSRTAI